MSNQPKRELRSAKSTADNVTLPIKVQEVAMNSSELRTPEKKPPKSESESKVT